LEGDEMTLVDLDDLVDVMTLVDLDDLVDVIDLPLCDVEANPVLFNCGGDFLGGNSLNSSFKQRFETCVKKSRMK
jgi:hypothetical protein